MASVPADTCTLARRPGCDAGADGVHNPGDFMSWHNRVMDSRVRSVSREYIAVAHAAGRDPQSDLPGPWLWQLPFGQFEFAARTPAFDYFHWLV